MNMSRVAKIWVSGVVQGVGFRYFVARLAKTFGIQGFVRNLPDGRVYIEASGEEGLLGEFLREVRIGPQLSRVSGMDVKWETQEIAFSKFEVRY